MSWLSNLFGSASARNSTGNFAWGVKGDVVQVLVQARTDFFGGVQTSPDLPFTKLDYAIEKGEPNIASLLRWNYQLVETLYGRVKEIADIEEWANDPRPDVLLRLIEGEGGSGKTRLGAEIARVFCKKGWQGGFLPRSGSVVHTPGKQGLLLIVDYPEEQPDRVDALVESIQSCRQPGYRLRILLLSRRRYQDWGSTFAHVEDLIGEQSIATLGALTHDDARSLVLEASRRLRKKLGKAETDDFHGLDQWLNANTQHRLSLYATAAAVHHVLAPEKTFGLRAADILIDLVKREAGRVNKASEAAKLGEDALARLLALATVTGKLTPAEIARLAKPGLQVFGCDENQAMNRLRGLPWWDRDANALPALTPDILAAVFTSHVLKNTPDMAPRWLWAALQDGIGTDFAARLGRVIHDIDLIDPKPSALPQWLELIVAEDSLRAPIFEALTFDGWLPYRLAGLAAAAGAALGGAAENDEDRALFLNNTSVDLAASGRGAEALAAAQRSVEIQERLVLKNSESEPALALSLHTLANRLGEAGEKNASLKAAQRSVNIYERLAGTNQAKFEPELAAGLNNLAIYLSESGKRPEALDTARRAAAIYQRLVSVNPALFEPGLAMNLNTLANCLGHLGDASASLEAVRQATNIYERLAAANPARFEPYLSASLSNLATYLSKLGDGPAALKVGQRAIEAAGRLAIINRERFEPDLALNLMAYAIVAQRAGEYALAAQNASTALSIWRRLAEESPKAYFMRLLQVLNDCQRIFAAAGLMDKADATAAELAALQEVLEIARRAQTESSSPSP